MRAIIGIGLAVCLLLAACGGSTGGSPVAVSSLGASTGMSSAALPPVPLAGVSPPTTASPNPSVTGTAFDACATITDADVTSWGLDPTTKQDVNKDVLSANVRGCKWFTKPNDEMWFLKVYAVNGSMAQWDQPTPQFDRKERVQIGSRQGWTTHDTEQSCSVVLPSQQGIVVVQIDPGRKWQLDKSDMCPRAVQIATAIEPKVP